MTIPPAPPPYPQYPPPQGYPNPYAQDSFTSYQPLARRVSGMALAGMILGILGVLLSIVVVGGLLGIIAILLATLGLVQIRKRPEQFGGKGFAFTGMALGVVSLVSTLVVVMLFTSSFRMSPFGRSRELANRSRCAASLMGIGRAMSTYALDNRDAFPVPPFAPYSAAINRPSGIGVEPPPAPPGTAEMEQARVVRAMYASRRPGFAGSPTAGPWMLVINSMASPQSFVCRSDPWASSPALVMNGTRYFDNFQTQTQLSYSFAYPWTSGGEVGAWWRNNIDSSLPVAADMAPLNGTGSPTRVTNPRLTPRAFASWNSANHFGEGQNVLFNDSHVEFTRRPDVGQNSDCIWTTAEPAPGSRGGTGLGGVAVDPNLFTGPATTGAPFDTVMLPVRNLTTGGM